MSTPTAPAGWYDDGQHPGQQRYWDGEQWTEHFHPPIVAQQPAPPARQGGPRHHWAWLAPVLVVVVAGGTVLGLALGGVFGGGDAPANAVGRLVAAISAQSCEGYVSAMSTRAGGGEAALTECESASREIGGPGIRASFLHTQTITTSTGATVLGVLTYSDGDDVHSTCYAAQTVLEGGTWRVDAIGSDGFPADVVLDSTAPGYCTGTPGLAG